LLVSFTGHQYIIHIDIFKSFLKEAILFLI
jgi:hypothetical protein